MCWVRIGFSSWSSPGRLAFVWFCPQLESFILLMFISISSRVIIIFFIIGDELPDNLISLSGQIKWLFFFKKPNSLPSVFLLIQSPRWVQLAAQELIQLSFISKSPKNNTANTLRKMSSFRKETNYFIRMNQMDTQSQKTPTSAPFCSCCCAYIRRSVPLMSLICHSCNSAVFQHFFSVEWNFFRWFVRFLLFGIELFRLPDNDN